MNKPGRPVRRVTDESVQIDQHIGNRIKLRRAVLRMSQEELGKALGLSFQQVQKYEHGTNRIPASRLYDIARALTCAPAYFFEELPPTDGAVADGDPMRATRATELVFHFNNVMSRDDVLGATLFELIRRISGGHRVHPLAVS